MADRRKHNSKKGTSKELHETGHSALRFSAHPTALRTPKDNFRRILLATSVYLGCCSAPLAQSWSAAQQPFEGISDSNFSFVRYDDTFASLADPALRNSWYTKLKWIPLDDSDTEYLTLGGDDRERIDSYQHPMFGRTGLTQDTTYLHRLLIHANLELDRYRVFVEFGNETENGRLPKASPTDTDRFDLQQAFLDIRQPLEGGTATLRIGREELLFGEGLLIGPRDAPNIRQDWDGVRASYESGGVRLDLLAVRPINNLPGIFDDQTSAEQALWGGYAAMHPEWAKPLGVDVYAFGTENTALTLSDGTGADHRTTVGGRLYGVLDGFDGVLELIGQTGSFDDRNVLAYAFHSELGYTEKQWNWQPRLGFRFDDLSGNRNRFSGTEGSFYAISPNLAYSTEATIEGASNLRQGALLLGLAPAQSVTVNYEFEGLWRDTTYDAFYAAPQIPLFQPRGANQRFSGTEQEIFASWRLNPFFLLKTALVHFAPGSFITSSGGHAINYAMVTGALRF